MKLITAIVRPGKLDDVTRAVINAGARGMTVTEVRGFGKQYGQVPEAFPAERATLLLPKLRVDAIAKSVRTGAIGDGKIWVCPVDGAQRVRTGECDHDAV